MCAFSCVKGERMKKRVVGCTMPHNKLSQPGTADALGQTIVSGRPCVLWGVQRPPWTPLQGAGAPLTSNVKPEHLQALPGVPGEGGVQSPPVENHGPGDRGI